MKKTPTELKKARHTYQQLPLNSPNFEIMIKQMGDEENLIEMTSKLVFFQFIKK